MSAYPTRLIITTMLGVALCGTLISGCGDSGTDEAEVEAKFQENQKKEGARSPKLGEGTPAATPVK